MVKFTDAGVDFAVKLGVLAQLHVPARLVEKGEIPKDEILRKYLWY